MTKVKYCHTNHPYIIKIAILLVSSLYLSLLHCFLKSSIINIPCQNYIYHFVKDENIFFYCKTENGVNIYRFDLQTQKSNFLTTIKGSKKSIYHIDYSKNRETIVVITNSKLKIVVSRFKDTRYFLRAKVFKNKNIFEQNGEQIFVDLDCDGYKEVILEYSQYYGVYSTKNLKSLKKLRFSFFEATRKSAPYDNIFFKITQSLPKLASFQYKRICFDLAYYSSLGIVDVYKNLFSKKIARIKTPKVKDKYDEFIVYPRPQPLINCDNLCKLIHFEHKKGIIYTSKLSYPYTTKATSLIKGMIIEFKKIEANIFYLLYIPKLNFLDFYELLRKNLLDIKLAIVKEENSEFKLLYEISLSSKVRFLEKEGFLLAQGGIFVCPQKTNNNNYTLTFAEKDAIYKYTLQIPFSTTKVKVIEKLKMENSYPLFKNYFCNNTHSNLILLLVEDKIVYLTPTK